MGTLIIEKYRNAILYFAHHVRNGTLGKVKLMKLLYYLDFDHFEQYGAPVTGDEYRHYPKGPVPIAAEQVVQGLVADGRLAVKEREIGYPYPMKEYIPLWAYDLSVFSPTEIDMLSTVAQKWMNHTGTDLVNATHGEPPWLETPAGATIDYRLALRRGNRSDQMAQAEADEEEVVVPLSVEEQDLRTKGLALIARVEEFARIHPEFLNELRAAEEDMSTGRYIRYNAEGVRE